MIILTGSSGGIGRKLIHKLAKIDKVLAIYNRNKPKNKILNVQYVKIDITQEKQINKLNKYFKKNDKVIFISLAAVKHDNLLINQLKKEFDKIINVNLQSNFLLSKFIIKKMIYSNWGRLIFFSSTGSKRGDIGTSAYSASKQGLIGLSKVISKEYGSYNITSNIIELGAFDTGMYIRLNPKEKNRIINKIPRKKLGSTIEINNIIKLIIDSDFINGSMIKIDGGAD